MGKMVVIVNEIRLGNRTLGWSAFDGRQMCEYTEKQIKDMIVDGKQKVCGLKIGESGALELDDIGFFTTNMTVHSHVGNWKPLKDGCMTNILYICIGTGKEKGKTVYECISSRFELVRFSEEDMRAYLKIGIISGGARLDGDTIEVASTELDKTS